MKEEEEKILPKEGFVGPQTRVIYATHSLSANQCFASYNFL